MKKNIIIAVLIILGCAGLGALYYYNMTKQQADLAQERVTLAQDITVFFNYAQQELQKNPASEQTELLKVINIIGNRNIQALKQLSPEQLQFKFRKSEFEVPVEQFKNNKDDRVVSRTLTGQNAIAFVLFHSILDNTPEDEEKTLAMLNVLFDKKLDPNTKAEQRFAVKHKRIIGAAVVNYSLLELAKYYSFKKAEVLLQEYMKSYKK